MKLNKYTALAVAAAAALTACSEMDELVPQGGSALAEQVKETNMLSPSRSEATFNGMFTKIGAPESVFGSGRPDDWGILMMFLSGDLEAADMIMPDSGYNWFSVCGELSSRNATMQIHTCAMPLHTT